MQIVSTIKLYFVRNWKLKLKRSSVFIRTMMLLFHILFKVKKGGKRGRKRKLAEASRDGLCKLPGVL